VRKREREVWIKKAALFTRMIPKYFFFFFGVLKSLCMCVFVWKQKVWKVGSQAAVILGWFEAEGGKEFYISYFYSRFEGRERKGGMEEGLIVFVSACSF